MGGEGGEKRLLGGKKFLIDTLHKMFLCLALNYLSLPVKTHLFVLKLYKSVRCSLRSDGPNKLLKYVFVLVIFSTFTEGFIALTYAAMPEISPPPPTETKIVSTSGRSSRISNLKTYSMKKYGV